MNWLRWYSGTVTDPKFQVVARKSGQPVMAVLAVWAMLLERASESDERGSVAGFDCESADVLIGADDGAACAIVSVMRDREMIVNDRIAKWECRQPKREDGSADRARAWRERNRTQPNATERTQTQSNARVEENREEKKEENPPTPHGGVDAGESPHDPLGDDSGELADIELEQFLEAYPRHAQTTAFAVLPAWKRMRHNRHYPGLPRLLEALNRWESSAQWRKDSGRFIPSPQKFIADRYWTREPPPEADPYTELTGGKTFAELNAPAMAAAQGTRNAQRKHESSGF